MELTMDDIPGQVEVNLSAYLLFWTDSRKFMLQFLCINHACFTQRSKELINNSILKKIPCIFKMNTLYVEWTPSFFLLFSVFANLLWICSEYICCWHLMYQKSIPCLQQWWRARYFLANETNGCHPFSSPWAPCMAQRQFIHFFLL